ncbi:MAG: fibronectin [Actinobacteria bacterium]|nr:fibronectin [Actinomycetota bacterium]
MQKTQWKRLWVLTLSVGLLVSFMSAPASQAVFKVAPAETWGNIYAGAATNNSPSKRPKYRNVETQSRFNVKYSNFPMWAKNDVQAAIDIWASNFPSTVPINVEASWGRVNSIGLLGSASAVNFYSGFSGAPDPALWYPSALANALAGKDLDKSKPEIIIQVNSSAQWNSRGDGKPTKSEFDLESVFLHELAHGLGFASNSAYGLTSDANNNYVAVGSLEQPTPFDAYAQTMDGSRLADIPTPSTQLASVLTSTLYWSGPLGIAANKNERPKLFAPSRYLSGSSISHLDDDTFAGSGLDSVMTPNLDPGEIFREPGALLLAMMEDMRNKPPVGVAAGIPDTPRNASAYVGDKSALIVFDPPANLRTAQLTEYVVTNLKTGIEKSAFSSPVLITGLKNGTTYSFSVIARNLVGDSVAAMTAQVTPQTAWSSSILDSYSDGKSLVSTTFNGSPVIAYTDSKSGDLKIALYDGKKWNKTTVDGAGGPSGRTRNAISGNLSMCVNGSRSNQTLHIFYSDAVDKDLRYATFNGKSFTFEVVDGNGTSINSYSDSKRVRSSSEVNISNACVATQNTVQVFYRDESQGILLGAVKVNSKPWRYEIVDGDSSTKGRTTGDVGYNLSALFDGSQTVVLYDSVVDMNQKKEITNGQVRVASRAGTDASGWTYQTLDMSTDKASVFGFNVALAKVGKDVVASWLSSSLMSAPKPDQIRWVKLSAPNKVNAITSENFGTPSGGILLDGSSIVFGCQDRLCSVDTKKVSLGQGAIRLLRSVQDAETTQSTWVVLKKTKYLVAGMNGKIVLLKP